MQPIYQRYERHAVAVARQYVPRRVADLALEPMGQVKRLVDDRLAGQAWQHYAMSLRIARKK